MTQEEKQEIINEVTKNVIKFIEDHLVVDVEGYYTEYSGQNDHYHDVNIYFKDNHE